MKLRDYLDYFRNNYEQPKMEAITVGFSGIDPSPKEKSGIPPTSETEKEQVDGYIKEVATVVVEEKVATAVTTFFETAQINVDSGEVSGE